MGQRASNRNRTIRRLREQGHTYTEIAARYGVSRQAIHQIASRGQKQPPPPLTPALCRAARGLLGWTQGDLAAAIGKRIPSISDFERGYGLSPRDAAAIIAVFGRAGVTLEVSHAYVGVRLATRRSR
jgi:transcriptional regulator with XRE-family HTH domain